MAEDAVFLRHGPAVPVSPLVVSVPHAGRDYPPALLASARLPRDRLELLEDRFADALVAPLAARDVTIFVATRARAWIDLNRSPAELDPAMLTPAPPGPPSLSRRVRSGLGLIPRRIGGAGDIYGSRLALADVMTRIAQVHAPWHDAIAAALAAAHARFGFAVLLECHSMPRLEGADAPMIVLGDRFGSSAGSAFTGAARTALIARGIRTALNAPYAGGYALERHGQPRQGIHAVQIEFCRSLYLDAGGHAPGAGLAATQALLDAVATAIVTAGEPAVQAAE